MNTQVIKRWQDIPQISEDTINFISSDRSETPCKMLLRDLNDIDYENVDHLDEDKCEEILLDLINYDCVRSELSRINEDYELCAYGDFDYNLYQVMKRN